MLMAQMLSIEAVQSSTSRDVQIVQTAMPSVQRPRDNSKTAAGGMTRQATSMSDTAREAISRFDGQRRSLSTTATATQTRVLSRTVPKMRTQEAIKMAIVEASHTIDEG